MANGKISKIDCDAAFYDDCHRRRRRDVGDSRGGPHLRPVMPRAPSYIPSLLHCLATAKALGITFPQKLTVSADEMIGA